MLLPRLVVLPLVFLPTVLQASPSPERSALLREGIEAQARGDLEAATEAFEDAVKLEESTCHECLLALARVRSEREHWKKARRAADQLIASTEEAQMLAPAWNVRALALFANGEGSEEEIEESVDSFRRALDYSGGTANLTRFNLANALLLLERDDEASEVLEEFLSREDGDGPTARRARALLQNPERARRSLVPEFSFETLDGETYSDASLRGKVVLLDFWATWCAPCVAALPTLRSLAERSEDEPFVLLSISSDQSLEVLERFVEKEGMTWPQAWDGRTHLSTRVFGNRAYPTYLLIGPEGEILTALRGGGPGVERQLTSEVGSALRAAKRAARARDR